jgi:hypothetical protein
MKRGIFWSGLAAALAPAFLLSCAISTVPVFEQARVPDGASRSFGLRVESPLHIEASGSGMWMWNEYRTRYLSGVASARVSGGNGRCGWFLRAQAGPGVVLRSERRAPGEVSVFPWSVAVGGKAWLPSSGTALRASLGYPWSLVELVLLQDITPSWTASIGTGTAGLLNAGVGFHHRFGDDIMGHVSVAASAWPVSNDPYDIALRQWAASVGIAVEQLPLFDQP